MPSPGILPEFAAPPVNEVAFGIRYEPVQGLGMAHMGLFWSKLRKEFPTCEQQQPIGPINDAADPATDLILPRVWLVHKNKNSLIQMQQNLFFLNWRKVNEGDIYPRYKKIKPQFEKRLNQFFDFLDQQELQRPKLKRYELTYINIVPKNQGWKAFDQINNILPDLCWRTETERFLAPPESMAWQANFVMPDDQGDLLVQLQTATSQRTKEQVLRLELTARNVIGDEPTVSVSEWLDAGHDQIVRAFADLTNPGVQRKHWKRKR